MSSSSFKETMSGKTGGTGTNKMLESETMSNTILSQKQSNAAIPPPDDKDEESEEDNKAQEKRKADTVCKNAEFERYLRERANSSPKNYNNVYKELVTSMNSGRPLKQRVDVPDGLEIYPYGNQKLNIWEF